MGGAIEFDQGSAFDPLQTSSLDAIVRRLKSLILERMFVLLARSSSKRASLISLFLASLLTAFPTLSHSGDGRTGNILTTGGEIWRLANRIFQTMHFGRPAAIPMSGTCNPEHLAIWMTADRDEHRTIERYKAFAGLNSQARYICSPVDYRYRQGTYTLIVPKLVDADQLASWLLEARTNVRKIDQLRLSNPKEFADYIISLPNGMDIDEPRNSPSLLMKRVSHLKAVTEIRDKGPIKEIDFAYTLDVSRREPTFFETTFSNLFKIANGR